MPLKTLSELKPLAKTLYTLKINNNGFQTLPGLLQSNKTFDKLRSLDISHNPLESKYKVQINIIRILFNYLSLAIICTTHYINYLFSRATNSRIFKFDRIDGTKYRTLWDTDT